MILLDSLYINNGGGKILLDYLIKSLEETNIEVFYLLDERIINNCISIKSYNHTRFLKASLFNRYIFYKKNKINFSAILCFANIPPNIKMDSKVYTYFHQTMFINTTGDFNLKDKIKFKLKIIFLNFLVKNSDYWLVQNKNIKNGLSKKYLIDKAKIYLIPFYPSVKSKSINKKENTYLYVSNASVHKNHDILIEAFCAFYDKFKKGVLTLTVSENFKEIYELIEKKKKADYPIENVGYVNQTELADIYGANRFFIFPSLAESFGLGLVEAIENECDVIGADLPYTYEVCKPSIVFDPNDIHSIKKALEKSLEKNIKKTESITVNQINKLIELLRHENKK